MFLYAIERNGVLEIAGEIYIHEDLMPMHITSFLFRIVTEVSLGK